MASSTTLLALDVGEKRIGVAIAQSNIRIAIAYDTLLVDGSELEQITRIVNQEKVSTIIIGYPRNQSGETTQQTKSVEAFAKKIESIGKEVIFQDESLTSVKAEEIVRSRGKPYQKSDIDALAASLILQDYLEQQYGRI
jgi:putative Holliday junction resolvase